MLIPRWIGHYSIFTSLALLLVSLDAFSVGASLMLNPHSLIFTDKSRSQVVNVVNRGDRTGVFTVRWIDHFMSDEGKLSTWKGGEPSPWSLKPHVRFSPRRVTLKPGESQVIRIALKKSSDKIPAGEFFSHLNVLTLNNNLEESLREKRQPKNTSSKISISTRSGISIPVIWRHTNEKSKAQVVIKSVDSVGNLIELDLIRGGSVSTRGYVHIVHKNNSTQKQLITPLPIVIYANLEKRSLSVPLEEVPMEGEIHVYYSKELEDLDHLFGESKVTL
jgi:fimbrial chaperone protein